MLTLFQVLWGSAAIETTDENVCQGHDALSWWPKNQPGPGFMNAGYPARLPPVVYCLSGEDLYEVVLVITGPQAEVLSGVSAELALTLDARRHLWQHTAKPSVEAGKVSWVFGAPVSPPNQELRMQLSLDLSSWPDESRVEPEFDLQLVVRAWEDQQLVSRVSSTLHVLTRAR